MNDRRPDIRAIAETFVKIIEHTEHQTGLKWQEDSFTAATVSLLIQSVMTWFGSKSAIELPEKLKNLDPDKNKLVAEWEKPPTTPPELANILRFSIIHEIEVSAHRDLEPLEKLKSDFKDTALHRQWFKDAQTLRKLRSK